VYLEQLCLNNNILDGTLPSTINNLINLVTLLLQYNNLQGNLDYVVNSTTQLFLQDIALSNNQFTGNIPNEAFKLKSLVSFGAGSNCLWGSLPESLCSSSSLSLLILDGVSSGSSCKRPLYPELDDKRLPYVLTKRITGHIPPCVFNMTSIQTLHLSGNSITGNIESIAAISPSLQYVSLSHNQVNCFFILIFDL
jgi:hypothetical protein